MYESFSKESWQKLHAALLKVKERGPTATSVGICDQEYVEDVADPCYMLRILFVLWPEYSGNLAFPVHTSKHKSARMQYGTAVDMWCKRTPYGRARRRLLDFCIEKSLERSNLVSN